MKKLLICLCMCFFLCGCGKESTEDVLKDFTSNINGIKSYKVNGTMEISNDEETFMYSLEAYYLKDNYYKVKLVNQTNNHEQIILKNNDDIYVITPALNKSFKFQSEWPDNSSQAYLLKSLANDIEKDKNKEISESETGYVIKSSVNYPNNEELTYQKIYLNKDKNVEKVEVFNKDDIVKIKVTFEKIDLKAGLNSNDFKLEDYIKEEKTETEDIKNNQDTDTNKTESNKNNIKNENCENEDCQNGENNSTSNTETSNQNTDSNNEEQTANIENIIYPLYIPSNTYLTSSETIDTGTGNRVILTFSGEKNFVLIEELSIASEEMEIIPVYGEPLMLSETIGALSANSLSWDKDNISYYLASTDLTVSEMQTIANSLGNTTLVNSTK